LRLVGQGPGLAEAAAEAKRLLVAEAVSVEDPMPPDRIWQEMASADCLVLIKFSGAEFGAQIPGKVFQYFALQKPILALVSEGETAEIVRRSGLGLIAPPDEVNAIADHLVGLWDAKADGRSIVTPVPGYIGQFSEGSMAEQLSRLLNTVRG
jgi:glycosyltransferase involved in cell wall biosynthesis